MREAVGDELSRCEGRSQPCHLPLSLHPSLLPHLDVHKGTPLASRADPLVEVEADATTGDRVQGHALEARELGKGEGGKEGGREGGRDGVSQGGTNQSS